MEYGGDDSRWDMDGDDSGWENGILRRMITDCTLRAGGMHIQSIHTHACTYIRVPLHTSMHSTYYGCGDIGSISLPLPQGQIPAELGQLSQLQQLHLAGKGGAGGRCESCPGSAGIGPGGRGMATISLDRLCI